REPVQPNSLEGDQRQRVLSWNHQDVGVGGQGLEVSRTNPRVDIAGRGIAADDPASRMRRVRVLAQLLDNSITIPGTGRKIGLDPIVGLIPGIGDLIGAVLSAYIILEAARADVSGFTLVRMVANVGFDTLLGSIPVIGDVFDAMWKSNTKNVAILERH